MKIYLAGPINGCTDAECRVWRDAIKEHFPDALDPLRRDFRGREEANVREVVEGDKADVEACDAVLAFCDRPLTGTAMEILFAWERGIPVVVWAPPGPVSPWLRYHATVVVHSMPEAIGALRGLGR